MERLFGGTANEAQMHSLHSECKNVRRKVDSAWENSLTILFIALYCPNAHQCADAREG